jgi:hypothetical protein
MASTYPLTVGIQAVARMSKLLRIEIDTYFGMGVFQARRLRSRW